MRKIKNNPGKMKLRSIVCLLLVALTSASSIRASRRSQLVEDPPADGEDPPATPPNDGGDDDADAVDPASLDPLQQALGAVEKTEENLDSVRGDMHDHVEDLQEAAVNLTGHAVNISDPDTYAKSTSQIDESSLALSSSNASLPDVRTATVAAREEARRIELENIRTQTEEAHKQAEAAAQGGAEGDAEGDADGEAQMDASGLNGEDDLTAKEALAALGANARVPLLKELVAATRDHTAQTTKYAELALQLQRDRLADQSKNATIAALSPNDQDEDSAEDQAVLNEEQQESEEDKLLLSPGRAQARAHCSDPVLKVAGFKWCVALQQCLQTWEHECPGGEWNGAMKKEVSHLTDQLKDMRHQHVQQMIDALRAQLEGLKKKAGITASSTQNPEALPAAPPAAVSPAGPGEYGRLKGHVLQLRLQISKYAKELKVPVPDDPYASKHLPVPTEYQHGIPASPGGAQGQSNQASQLAARLSTLVNEIATTKERSAIALMNREVDAILSKLRTMTLGSHCMRCGKAHCDVHDRDAMLWPALPTKGPPSLLKNICGCHSLANPKCACPKKSCAPPPPKKEAAGGDCDCPKKKDKCGCGAGSNNPPPCGGKGEPRCVTPPVMCEDPGTPMHAVRLGQTYTEGSKLQFLCQPPYKLVGDEFRTCTMEARTANTPTGDGNGGWRRAGDWTGLQPTCVPPSCPKPRAVEDGAMVGSDFRFPAKVEFQCNTGYTMEGVDTLQCLGSGQWNGVAPKCYPLQTPSEALTAVFDKGKEEANALAKEMGIEQMKERDPTPEETASDEEHKEEEAAEMMKEKSEATEATTKKEQQKQEDLALKAKGAQRSIDNNNQVGSLEQLEHVAKHAQLELKRAEANRKDVEALVLANSASTSMAEAYGNTANLLSGKDPVGAEEAAEKRATIVKNLLDSGSPLYRDSGATDVGQRDQDVRGRSAASAAASVATQFAQELLNALMASQPNNPDTANQDQAERNQVLAQASASASKAGYAAGVEKGIDDEAGAIKAGKLAGAQSAAEVLAPLLGMTAEDVLKNNQDKLEVTLRHALSALTDEPSSPSELAASSTESAIAAAEKQATALESKKKQLEDTKTNAVNAVKKEIEHKLENAVDAEAKPSDKMSDEEMERAAVEGAENAVKQQLDVMSKEEPGSLASGNGTDANEAARRDSNQLTEAVTNSIADEAVQSVLKAAKTQEENVEMKASASGPGTPAERIQFAQEQAQEEQEKQAKAQEEFDMQNAEQQQAVADATKRVDEEKAQKEMVEQNKRVEEDKEAVSLDTAAQQVGKKDPELVPDEVASRFLRR